MTDLTRITELLEELLDRMDQLQAQIAELRAEAVPEAPGARAVRPAAPLPPGLDNIIPPTQTDDPDSIVGGRRTRRGDFPDCCAVGNESGYFCTGTLIAPTVVVTAKHCLGASRVFLRGNDVERPERGETRRATAIPHPDPAVDLQVLVLEKPSTVKPRPVAKNGEGDGATEAMLVGFGTVDLSGTVGYGVKRQVKVPIMSLDCSDPKDGRRYGCRKGFEIVAGHRGLRRDSCRGDSGGPLYVEGADGGYYLLGATSRGARDAGHMCGDGGVYVRVDKFAPWIREVTGVEV